MDENMPMNHGVESFSTPSKSTKDVTGFLKSGLKSVEKSLKLARKTLVEENIDVNSPAPSEIPIRPESSEENSEVEVEEVDEVELLRQQQQRTACELKSVQEQLEHYQMQSLTLQRSIEIVQEQHQKDIKLKNQEITDQRVRAQKAEEERDKVAIEYKREKLAFETENMAKVNQLRAELNQYKTMSTAGPGASFRAGKSFSMKGFLGGGSSQKLQAKVQANAAEREHARKMAHLQEMVDKYQIENYKLIREKEDFLFIGAQMSSEITELKEEVEQQIRKNNFFEERLKKAIARIKELKLEQENLVLKAGWAAEQLQATAAELAYERQKHVKVSRLQTIKQAEELERLKEENELLKKSTPVKEKPTASAKKSTSKLSTEVSAPVRAAPVEAPVLLGTETIAELVALKAKQREQQQIKIDALINKNREEKQMSANDSDKPVDMNRMFIKAIQNRGKMLHEESAIYSELDSEDEEWC